MKHSIKIDDRYIVHLGQPPLHSSSFLQMDTVDKLGNSLMQKLEPIEREEERELRRKYEALHPNEAD
jgi:hypothetical protein